MQADLMVLVIAAITISCLHTVTGPDHYLPFVALSKSLRWSFKKTIAWTVVCGCGHIASSILIGLGGAAMGWSLSKVTWLEDVRGGVAGWALLGFGLIYALWGLIKAKQNLRHKNFDTYEDGRMYVYEHEDGIVVAPKERFAVTPWVVFLIFVLGPCEPMIPPALFSSCKKFVVRNNLLIIFYTIFTLATMVLMVVLGYYGVSFLKPKS
jgi:sulfite exporter TauE/SafE